MTDVKMVTVTTDTCTMCGQGGEVQVPAEEFDKWDHGRGPYIQKAMPSVSADVREQILTGTHPACWDALWKDMETETED